MPTNEQNIVLNYDRTRLDGIRMDGQVWLRGDQIAPPLAYRDERSLRLLYERHRDEFTPDETRLIVEQTAGGAQQVRVFSLNGVRLLAMLARTEPAARFRRWVLDLLSGKAPLGLKAPGDLLETVEGPPRLSDHPMVRAAVHRSMEAGGVVSAAFRDARQMQREARRMAALAGLSARELKQLVERERWNARRPSMQSPLFDA